MYDIAVFGGGKGAYSFIKEALEKDFNVLFVGNLDIKDIVFDVALDFLVDIAEKTSSLKYLRDAGVSVFFKGLELDKILHKRNLLIEDTAISIKRTLKNKKLTILENGKFLNNYTFKSDDTHYLFKNLIVTNSLQYKKTQGINTVLDYVFLEKYPEQIAINGSDKVALQLAFVLAQFQKKVSIIDEKTHILPQISSEFNSTIIKTLKKEKIKFHPNTSIIENEYYLRLEDGTKIPQCVVVDNTKSPPSFLPLEALRLDIVDNKIQTDNYLKTKFDNIFVIDEDFSIKEQVFAIISNILKKNSTEFLKIDSQILSIGKKMAKIGDFVPTNAMPLQLKKTNIKLSLKDSIIKGAQVLEDRDSIIPLLYFAIKNKLTIKELEAIIL